MPQRSVLAVGLAVLVLVAGCSGASTSASAPGSPAPAENSTIRVVGSGSAAGEPDKAVVSVGVRSTADDAVTARRWLAENVSTMRSALDSIGVEADQVTTRHYDIDRYHRRPRREDAEPRVQYRASHSFRITLSEIDRVGAVIDTAVGNGATDVDTIEFTLSTDRRRQLEKHARQAAMRDARQKAEEIAAAANLTVTGVKVVRVGGGAPRPSDTALEATPTPEASDGTDVESGPVTVTTTLRVVYTAEETGNADTAGAGTA